MGKDGTGCDPVTTNGSYRRVILLITLSSLGHTPGYKGSFGHVLNDHLGRHLTTCTRPMSCPGISSHQREYHSVSWTPHRYRHISLIVLHSLGGVRVHFARFNCCTVHVAHREESVAYINRVTLGLHFVGSSTHDHDFYVMMTSSNGNIFHVTGPLWGESTGHRWILLTEASDAELWCFFDLRPEQTVE